MDEELKTGPDGLPENGKRKSMFRLVLFFSVPFLLIVGGLYIWATGGRYVTTENAYVKRDKVSVSTDVAGRIKSVDVKENQRVTAGQVLFEIDDADFIIAVSEAEGELAAARLDVEQLRASYKEHLAAVQSAREDLEYQKTEFGRRKKLRESGYAAEADYDRARHAMQVAEQKLATEQQAANSVLASLGGKADIKTEDHPKVRQMAAKRDQAKLNLDRTTVRAPIDGIVSQASRLLPGQYMIIGAPAMSVVETTASWVEANFKETDLTYMVVGQKAKITFDALPGRTFEATVGSIGAATGAEFAILPPQNATGNWVKVVQRIPVRLIITDPNAADSLQAGLSAHVSVDTEHQRLFPTAIETARAHP